ncbi:MAG: aspartate dehydrogenase [Ruminococcus flavefaciens]|nr:aspartate dehydrogenase [Ruminococcus flavefaciens]
MFRKKQQSGSYDRENLRPIIRASICTGEKVAGFRDVRTGKFTEIMLIRGDVDMAEFLDTYGISPEEIKKEW